MASRFFIDMLPGLEGDCFWIEYGEEGGRTHRVLIDGGRGRQAYDVLKARFAELPDDEKAFDLLVNTHVDADHIEGLLRLVEDDELDVTFDDVWFNGFEHLTPPPPGGIESFGPKQGERFTKGILTRDWNWNRAFDKHSVVVPDEGDLPIKTLPGGMELTLLSPNWDGLKSMKSVWIKKCKEAGLIPGTDARREEIEGLESFGNLNSDMVLELADSDYEGDSSEANATSIAFIAEFGGKRALFAGDAHVETLLPNLQRVDTPTRLDAFKVSHHGSRGTLSKELMAQLDCDTFLISTNGSRHHHPHRAAIARIVTSSDARKKLICNYGSDEMLEWDQAGLRAKFKYKVIAPNGASDGTLRTEL